MQNIACIKNPIKASLVTYKNYLNNKIFDPESRDNITRKFIYLRNKLKEENIDLQTCDINLPEESELSIHFDVIKIYSIKAIPYKYSYCYEISYNK